MYLVILRSDMLSGIGAHSFPEPLLPGKQVEFQGEAWNIDDVDDETSPPTVTLAKSS